MHRGRLYRRLSALLLTLLLIATTTSCGRAEDLMEKAGDVLEDVKDAVAEDSDDSDSDDEAGGQTVSRPPRPTGTLTTGQDTPLVSETVDASGGAVTVDKPGDPLDGLEIQVPPGAYAGSEQFEVSSAPIDGHDFGEHFTPATPLITIENGGDYSEEFITVRIPVDIPPDHFAMAFYYDRQRGSLEGIPFKSVDEDSITIVTRHFCDIIVSIIKNSVLDDLMKADIDSLFRPGIDDWQFTNYGSYIAPGGHCAGQSLTALWYFCEQPDGVDLTLCHRYDKNGVKPATPDMWMDDSHGYRLASTVQGDLAAVWPKLENQLFKELAGVYDEAHFKAFAYAIQLTGEPQVIYVYSSAGGGHAMVVYRVHKDSLYIADPNYPGNNERRIEYSNGQFKPYESGANADAIAAGNSTRYDLIGYVAKTASVDWKIIATRWSEFKAGTIGNDSFPHYVIVVVDDENDLEELVDGYESENKKIRILASSTMPIGTKVYRNGTRIQPDANDKYELEDGNNLIGIDIWGDLNNNPQSRKYRYIDFQYFNIQYGESECHGWVLDSIVEKEFSAHESDEFERNLVFEASSDGWYSSSGRHVVGTLEGDVLADWTASGSWTPPPDCIRPNEPVQLELTCSTNMVLSRPIEWGIIGNHLSVDCDALRDGGYGLINHEVNSANPTMEDSIIVEFQLFESEPGLCPVQIAITCSTYGGRATYVYTYVWQD